MMVVDMDRGKPSPARRVMDWPHSVFMPATQFDVLPDGSFITAPVRVNDDPYRADHIEVVVNFATLLERRMEPAAGGD